MTFNEIVAGIDRHFRLRGEGRQRRAATEAGVSFAWPQGTNLTRKQMEIAMRDSDTIVPNAAKVQSGAASLEKSTIGWQPGPTPVLGWGDAFDSKAAIRQQLAACRGDCGHEPPPDYEVWAR